MIRMGLYIEIRNFKKIWLVDILGCIVVIDYFKRISDFFFKLYDDFGIIENVDFLWEIFVILFINFYRGVI